MLGVAQRVVLQRPLPVPTPVLIGTWSFDETGGTTFADSAGTVDGTFVGTWDDLTTGSMVTGVPGTSAFKAGTAYGILPAGNPAHDLSSLTISIYVQRGAAATRQTVLAIGQDQPGDLSVEILGDDSATPGRLRAFHVGQDGALRFFESTDGITGTNLAVGAAYRIDLSLGAQGARIYLNGTELTAAAIPAHTNGWNNAVPKYLGIWTDGASSPVIGALDQMRLWEGQLAPDEIATLEAAQSVTLPNPPANQAVAPEADSVPLGARYAASGWGRAGAVVALNGRTSVPMKVLDDPRAVYSGNKVDVQFEFRSGAGVDAFPGGTWAADANGDIVFTSDGSTGVKSGEYRFKGTGDSFSEWTPLRIEAIARPSGTLFDIEDEAGSDTAKIQAAIDAANSAGGGVVYSSLGHSKEYVLTDQLRWRHPRVSFFDLKLKRTSPTYNGGDPATAGNYTGMHTRFSRMLTTALDQGAWTGDGTPTARVVNCLFDSNGFDQPICNYSGAGGNPSGTPGNVDSGGYGWPGEPPGQDGFNMQQQHCIAISNNSDTPGPTVEIKLCSFIHACGDGVSFNHDTIGTMEYCFSAANQRGFFVVTGRGGDYTIRRCYDTDESQRSDRPFLTPGSAWDTKRYVAAGFDIEPENQAQPYDITIEKCFIASDFDNRSAGNTSSTLTVTDVTTVRPMAPQIQWSRALGEVSTYTRCTLHCHKEGGNKGGTLTVSGTSSNPRGRSTGGRQIYDDCDWYMGADDPVWAQHGERLQIVNNSECGWIFRRDASADAFQLEIKGCRYHRLVPAGISLGTLYAFWATSSMSTDDGLVILSGHITFDSGFAQFPFRGNGGTIRILSGTTFEHADFPGANTFWSNYSTVQDQR